MSDSTDSTEKWTLEMIHKFIFLMIALLVLNIFAALFFINTIDSTLPEMNMVLDKVLYSQDSFILHDEGLSRTYTGIVDLSKFNQTTLNNTLNHTSSRYSLRAKIGNQFRYFPTQKEYQLMESYKGVGGVGGVDSLSAEFVVLTVSDYNGKYETYTPSTLNITVLRSRS